MECNSIPFISFINFIHHFFLKCSSHPLFSTIVALYTLILLYAPSFFLRILLNPILNTTGITLLSLLRLGANERSRKKVSVQESKTIDSSANKRLENESSCLGSIDLGHKDIHDEWLSIDGDNLCTYSSLVIESSSLEPTFLDFIDQTQTHVNECDGKMDLAGRESNPNHAKLEPISSLDIESNQMHVELEHDLGSESKFLVEYQKWDYLDTNFMESSQLVVEERKEMDSKQQVDTKMKFYEWNMKAPLEIIYEAYEGEEEDEESDETNMVSSDIQFAGCERYPSLSMYYPESETDHSSSDDDDFQRNEDWESHERVFFKWEEELDDRPEELIEISLDRYGKTSIEFSHADEDNMIEIDIFPTARH